MKKTVITLMVFALVLAVSAPVFAEGTMEDLKGHVTTIVKAPLQVPNHITGEYESHGLNPLALFGGTMKGIFYFGHDVVSGVYHVVTMPVTMLK